MRQRLRKKRGDGDICGLTFHNQSEGGKFENNRWNDCHGVGDIGDIDDDGGVGDVGAKGIKGRQKINAHIRQALAMYFVECIPCLTFQNYLSDHYLVMQAVRLDYSYSPRIRITSPTLSPSLGSTILTATDSSLCSDRPEGHFAS